MLSGDFNITTALRLNISSLTETYHDYTPKLKRVNIKTDYDAL